MQLKSSNKGKYIMNINGKIVAPEERHRKIETAAYYRAQKRGFSNGDPLKDWLEAEREIDASFTVGKMGPRWDAVSEKRHGLFEIWKGKGDQFFNQAQSALNSWVSRYRNQMTKKNIDRKG
jgi:hypothetical protein